MILKLLLFTNNHFINTKTFIHFFVFFFFFFFFFL